jgi:hypothetical protein
MGAIAFAVCTMSKERKGGRTTIAELHETAEFIRGRDEDRPANGRQSKNSEETSWRSYAIQECLRLR